MTDKENKFHNTVWYELENDDGMIIGRYTMLKVAKMAAGDEFKWLHGNYHGHIYKCVIIQIGHDVAIHRIQVR